MSAVAVKYTARHFTENEFSCKCAENCTMKGPDSPMDAKLVIAVDLIRSRLGAPVRVNSGKRCAKHNAAVGGDPKSRHMKAEAVDISAGDYNLLIYEAGVVCEWLGLKMLRYDKERFLHLQL